MKTYHHQVLEVSSAAGEAEITRAYKKMAARWHPDLHPDDREHATKNFNEIRKAYHALLLRSKALQPPTTHAKRTNSSTTTDSELTCSTSTLGSRVRLHSSNSTSSSTSPITPSSISTQPTHPCDVPTSKSHIRRANSTSRATPSAIRSNEAGVLPQGDVSKRSSIPQMPHKLMKRRIPRGVVTDYVPAEHEARTGLGSSGDHGTRLAAYGPPLVTLGMNESREWSYALTLTLEELSKGKTCHLRITRHLLSGKTKCIMLDVHIPPGCREGMKILCTGVGHERRDRTLQDIAFIIKEADHDRFLRIDDDLYVDVRLPYIESFRRERGRVRIDGLNDEKWKIDINYPKTKSWTGVSTIEGAGMPIRSDGQVVGRGRLVVRWEMTVPEPSSLPFFRSIRLLRASS